MRRIRCEGCGTEVPMNESCAVFGRLLCAQCAQKHLESLKDVDGELPEDAVEIQVDPTVCSKCGMDNGSQELRMVIGLPLCPLCYDEVSVPFPTWVKVSFVVVLGVAMFSLVRNTRFFRAHSETRRSIRAAGEGDVEQAYSLITSAAKRVPESTDLQKLREFYRAALLIQEEKYDEALPILKKLKSFFGDDWFYRFLRLTAEASLAFDEKDYDKFLTKQKALLKLAPNAPIFVAGVASAYACKYVVSGDEKFKKLSLSYLESAGEKADKGDERLKEYEDRIRHRLKTREVITREEYNRRFGKEEPKE